MDLEPSIRNCLGIAARRNSEKSDGIDTSAVREDAMEELGTTECRSR